ncbi:AAA family ATPase [Zhihengliuella salsuginis]|uniref:AAA family ATPase n=1 Tax=Zhihengliuella salsuginis TaxID=578222 RepID=UPI0016760568|nr:chromosome partitioning protein [Zhihengliuella salsuginis]
MARQCEDILETIALVESGLADAVLLAGASPDIDAHVVDALRERGAVVVALVDDPGEQARLQELGVTCESATASPQALADLFELTMSTTPAPSGALNRRPADTEQPAPEAARGQVIAVWGPTGAPGRTTLAVNYAVESALAGSAVALVDADTYGASISVHLGLMEESAGIAQLCRLSDQGVLDRSSFERACPVLPVAGARIRVATGLPRPQRWPELRKSSLERVLAYLRTIVDVVVVDVAALLEQDEELSFDTAAPQRNAATLAVLENADEVIAVGQADAVGVPRMIKALEQLGELLPDHLPRVVFNKMSKTGLGPNPERQLRETWERFGPSTPIRGYLPWDGDAAALALLKGNAFAESSPEADLRVSIARLAGHDVTPRRNLFSRRRGGGMPRG